MSKQLDVLLSKIDSIISEGNLPKILSTWRELDSMYLERQDMPGEEVHTEIERINRAKEELSNRFMRLC